ncbi:hypothetical protein [Actinoallomurus sp. NPDC052274]|uniref:hypothetical protein n=1 Tax=Actinoallomurus sp. NPDC052274 TaxID=3155420 RepID=UPI003424BA37
MAGWFERTPFRRGVTLLAVLIIVPALIIGGLLAVDSGGKGDGSRSQAAVATPSAQEHDEDSGTVERTERALGEIVASRSARPAPTASTASAAPSASHRASARPRPTRTTAPSPSESTKCPPELKKWPWMWDLCKRRRGGHGRP